MAGPAHFKNVAITITVHPNRVEIEDKRGCFGFVMPKRTTIPLRSLASVETPTGLSVIVLRTLDGKVYKYPMPGAGKLRKAIEESM